MIGQRDQVFGPGRWWGFGERAEKMVKSFTLVLLLISILALIKPLEGGPESQAGCRKLSGSLSNSSVPKNEHKDDSSGGSDGSKLVRETKGGQKKARKLKKSRTTTKNMDSRLEPKKERSEPKVSKRFRNENRKKQHVSSRSTKDTNVNSKTSKKTGAPTKKKRNHDNYPKSILIKTSSPKRKGKKRVKFNLKSSLCTGGVTTIIPTENDTIDWELVLRTPSAKEMRYRQLIANKEEKVARLSIALSALYAKMNAMKTIDEDIKKKQEASTSSKKGEKANKTHNQSNQWLLNKAIQRRDALSKGIAVVLQKYDEDHKNAIDDLERTKQQALDAIEKDFLKNYGLDASNDADEK